MARPAAPRPPAAAPARVVLLLEELNFGGTQRQTLELARRLDPGRFRAEIWLLRAGGALAPLARKWGVPVTWLARTKHVGPLSLATLWRRLRREKIDLLLTLTAVPNIWGRILGRLAGLPGIIGNVRSHTAHRQHEGWLWRLADRVVCNNAALLNLLLQEYGIPADRLTLIPNGVDTAFFQPGEKERTGPGLKILSIGRLVPDKDQETLVRAFSLVLPDHPAAELWLVGEGPCRERLAALLREIIPPGRARLLPGREDIRPLLEQADLFALSSVTEALPNVVLEAMAAGLPVVATAVGGLPEVVLPGRTGWLIPPREPAALAGALGLLLAEPELRRSLGRAGRERAVQEYSFTTMVSRFEALFAQVLAHTKLRSNGDYFPSPEPSPPRGRGD